jgi:hypothetical protein
MENTTDKHLARKADIAVKHAYNVARVLNDAEYNDSVDKTELIRLLRDEYGKFIAKNDDLWKELVADFNKG